MVAENNRRGENSSNKLISLVVMMNLIIIFGVVAVLYFSGEVRLPIGKGKQVESMEYVAAMDSFTVNLKTENRLNSYLKTEISFMYNDDTKKDQFVDKQSQIRDVIIKELMKYSSAELLASGGLEYAKTKLLTEVNSVFGEDVVKEIYFTDFLIQ